MNWILLWQRLAGIFKLKGYTLLNLTGLVVAVTVFIVISHIAAFELSFDKYHNDYNDIYRVKNTRVYKNLNDESAGCPPATGPTLKNEIAEIAESARIKQVSTTVLDISQGNERSQYYHNQLYYADASVFRIFTFSFISGNPDEALKEIGAAVVTKDFGLKYFGKENALGEKFTCSNDEGVIEYTVKAVIDRVPANSYLDFDCLLSYTTLVSKNSDAQYGWGWNSFNTFVKLKADADIEHVNKKLAGVVTKYNLSTEELTRVFELQPIEALHLHSNLRHEIGRRGNAFMISVLISIAVFILLVAWVNYVNLSIAKSKKQLVEVQVKKVLGCTKKQIFYEQVFDALILNTLSVIISIVLIKLLSPLFKNWYHIELHNLNLKNWSILLAFSVLVSILSGLYPAWVLFDKNSSLKTKYTGNKQSFQLKNGLVVFQFAVSIVFIIATILILKQIQFMEAKQDELAMENVISLKSLTTTEEAQRSQKAFIDEILKLPDIKNTSVSNSIPGGAFSNVLGGIKPLGESGREGIKCYFIDVNESFFNLYNIELVAGSNFKKYSSDQDENIIINVTALKMLGYVKPSDAINQKVIMGEMNNEIRTIVGVTEDYHQKSLQEPINPSVFNYKNYGNYISVRYGNTLSSDIIPVLQKSWEKMIPNQPFDFEFNNTFYAAQYDNDKVFSRLVSTFALLIIFISCIGLYALARFAINNKIKEIGIRKVNGAEVWEVMAMLNKNFVIKIVLAFVVAFPIAWYAMHEWLQNFAYKTELSWWVFALAGVLALGIALLTVSWQSWKAATRNPVEALRYE